ncbi:MAG: hypothetical protein WCJ58_03975 [bacterium]
MNHKLKKLIIITLTFIFTLGILLIADRYLYQKQEAKLQNELDVIKTSEAIAVKDFTATYSSIPMIISPIKLEAINKLGESFSTNSINCQNLAKKIPYYNIFALDQVFKFKNSLNKVCDFSKSSYQTTTYLTEINTIILRYNQLALGDPQFNLYSSTQPETLQAYDKQLAKYTLLQTELQDLSITDQMKPLITAFNRCFILRTDFIAAQKEKQLKLQTESTNLSGKSAWDLRTALAAETASLQTEFQVKYQTELTTLTNEYNNIFTLN